MSFEKKSSLHRQNFMILDRLADFAVSVGYVHDDDRQNLKFENLVPIGFQKCKHHRDAIGKSVFIDCG